MFTFVRAWNNLPPKFTLLSDVKVYSKSFPLFEGKN